MFLVKLCQTWPNLRPKLRLVEWNLPKNMTITKKFFQLNRGLGAMRSAVEAEIHEWAQILCYKNQGIHWYHCNPTFLWLINFRLVRRLISALIWDISGLWNRSDGQDFREKLIVFSRFLTLYHLSNFKVCTPLTIGRSSIFNLVGWHY